MTKILLATLVALCGCGTALRAQINFPPVEYYAIEHCHIWTCGGGGRGYDKTGTFRPMSWFFDEYVTTRSLGGNFLPNVGPDGNGDMHPNFYR